MASIVVFFLILLLDTLVFKNLVGKMAADLDVELPDYAESAKHCSIANLIGLLVRIAGWKVPAHFLYFYHVFYNRFGLNRVAVFICLLSMGLIEVIFVVGLDLFLRN